jgi:hypothetical protein
MLPAFVITIRVISFPERSVFFETAFLFLCLVNSLRLMT